MKLEYPRLPPELVEYLPLLSTGLHLLISTWEFPPEPPGERRKVKVRLDEKMADQVEYLAKHAGKSRAAVITAALIRAKYSNRRPQAGQLIEPSKSSPNGDAREAVSPAA